MFVLAVFAMVLITQTYAVGYVVPELLSPNGCALGDKMVRFKAHDLHSVPALCSLDTADLTHSTLSD